MEQAKPGHLSLLQAFRAFASLWVLSYHVNRFAERYWHAAPVTGFVRSGQLGVDFFFVISGFVILYIHRADIGQPAASARFLFKRVLRIYPPYLLVLLVKSAYLFFVGFGVLDASKFDLNVFASSALLLPAPSSILDISWSLTFELLFYSVFLFGILAGWRMSVKLWWAWLLAVVCAGLGLVRLTDPFLAFLFSPYCAEFMLGCLAAYLYPRVKSSAALVLLALGAAGMAYGVGHYVPIDELGRGPRCFYWGLSFFCVLLGGIALARDRKLRAPAVAVRLGDASYSIYLVHNSFQFFVMALVAKRWGVPAHPSFWIWILAVVSAAVGYGYHLGVETPMLTRTNAWLDRRFPRSER